MGERVSSPRLGSARRGRRDPWLAGAGSFVLCALLGQDSLNADGPIVPLQNAFGQHRTADNYYAYPFLFTGLRAVLEPLGVGPYRTGLLLSALGTSAGVGFGLQALRVLGLDRRRAWLGAALVAFCPAVLFFGSTLEFHGPFFGFAGLALLSTARAIERPSAARGAELGLCTALAFLAHLDECYRLEPVESGAFRAKRVLPR